MKTTLLFLGILYGFAAYAQTDTSGAKVIFFDSFNNNNYSWTVADTKRASAKIENGFYYLTANGHAYGEEHEIKIDTHKDFEIEARIKILNGKADHKNYYSMLFWGREAMESYYFTFAKDGFTSVESCDGKSQGSCSTRSGWVSSPNRGTGRSMPEYSMYGNFVDRKTGKVYPATKKINNYGQIGYVPFFNSIVGHFK